MDPPRSDLGDATVCNTITNLIEPEHNLESSSATSIEESSGQKKRRQKSKNAIKELNVSESLEEKQEVLPVLPVNAVDQAMREVQDFMKSLQVSSTEQVPADKPKRNRPRRRKRNGEKSTSDPREGSSSQSVNEDLPDGEPVNDKSDLTNRFLTNVEKLASAQLPNSKNDQFFANNKKGSPKKRRSNGKKMQENEVFEEYLPPVIVEYGLANKTMIAGAIRINPRCYKEAYISSEGDSKDLMIIGLAARNRALEGDEVVVLINPATEWKEKSGQRTGKVIYIKEKCHSRTCIGKLPSSIEPNSSYVVFSPRDPRVPRIKISLDDQSLPRNYIQGPASYAEVLFNAEITSWTNVNFAQGRVMEEVGRSGDLEVETMAIMLENNLDPQPHDPLLSMFFPQLPYTIPDHEIAKRLDLRKECIFTIDPATAKDLDDAVSVKRLDNGNIEVGVHISDVSYFLQPDTLLDKAVCKRATTVYLVQRVYHMLPVSLCQLCSLTPEEDKLAFSVFVELNHEARAVSHRFARSVIRSCVKMAYEHAQVVIDNPEKVFTAEDFPEIGNGFTAEDCAQTIRELFKLSVIMRKRRFDTGALRIDQPKLCFHLDPQTNIPLHSFIYENKESHRLIEEFMLLANMTVAEHIYLAFPKLAFLRHHLPPRPNMMQELQKKLEGFGIHIDITNAGTVHDSMRKYSQPLSEEDATAAWARYIILNNLCAKPMLRANYFCPSDEMPDLHHYALNADCYTHFTSPIRRYADVMVHRLLASSLDLAPQPSWSHLDTKRIAHVCNRQKLAAKVAGEQSSQLFLALFLQQPVECVAAVIDVKDRSVDVIAQDFGIVLRAYTDPLNAKVEFVSDKTACQLTIRWQGEREGEEGPVQVLQLFSVVRVLVGRAKDSLKLTATLLPPSTCTAEQQYTMKEDSTNLLPYKSK